MAFEGVVERAPRRLRPLGVRGKRRGELRPLIDHIYIDTQGYPFFVRERGHLQGVVPLRRGFDERLADLARKEETRLQQEREEVERRTRPEAATATPPPEEPLVYRKRSPLKP